MLNTISDIEAAAEARAPFGVGACLPSDVVRPDRSHEGTAAFTHPRAFRTASVLRRRELAGDAGMALGRPNPGMKQQYPYPTRIAASGGAKGSHPAREPEPA